MVWRGLGLAVVVWATACRYGFEAPPGSSGSVSPDVGITTPPDGIGTCDAAACAAAGGSCVDGACQLVADSESVLQCAAGMPCRLVCNGERYCRDGARCDGATWCEVLCVGYRACQAGVVCGSVDCMVTCNGIEACENGVSATGTCMARCCGAQTCGTTSSVCTVDSNCS